MTRATTRFPDNLVSLHRGEEQLRNQSIAATQAAENLSAHVAAVESAMDLIDYIISAGSTGTETKTN